MIAKMLRTAMLICISASLVLYLSSIPLGLGIFLDGHLSQTYSIDSPLIKMPLPIRAELSFGATFTLLTAVFTICFVLALQSNMGFARAAREFYRQSEGVLSKNYLFALPILSSLTYVLVTAIMRIQEAIYVPTGTPPLPQDLLLSYLSVSIAPISEEIIFRIIPIGAFYTFLLMNFLQRTSSTISLKTKVRIYIFSFINPKLACHAAGRNARDGQTFAASNLDKWMIIASTSILFAISHYLSTGTWGIGKIPQTFIQGLVMGFSYISYGFYAPILLHWFFDYYQYTEMLAGALYPELSFLPTINQIITLSLGIMCFAFYLYKEDWKRMMRGALSPDEFSKAFKAVNDWFNKTIRNRFKYSELKFHAGIILLVAVLLGIRFAIIFVPSPSSTDGSSSKGFVFDEAYYVDAARKMLQLEPTNNEHPPLAKALIMLGISTFGDNPLGWRFFSIVTSCLSVVLLYFLALHLTQGRAIALCAASLFTLDIMAFNIGQIAMLDGPMTMFTLAALLLVLQGRYDIGGFFLGLAVLSKLTAVFTAVGIVCYVILDVALTKKDQVLSALRTRSSLVMRTLLVGLVVFLLGLWFYDSVYGVFGRNPLQHIIYMFNYHNSLTYNDPADVILPLQWISPLTTFTPMPFYVISQREIQSGGIVHEFHPIAYYGIYAPLWWSIWLVLPMGLLDVGKRLRKGEKQGVGLFAACWTLSTFIPYVILAYFERKWVYPFYFYPTLIGLYIGLSYFCTRSRFKNILMAIIVLLQLLWFVIWFPVKPMPLIDILLLIGLPV